MTGMIVDELSDSSESLRKEISARIQTGSNQNQIWFRWKGDTVLVPGDVIFCTILVPAMRAGGKLEFHGSISRELAGVLPELQILLMQNDRSLQQIEIETQSVDGPQSEGGHPSPSAGALFQSDISAFYILLKNHQQIQDLVYVQNSTDGSFMATFKSKTLFKRYASVLNKNFLELETNSDLLFGAAYNGRMSGNPLMAIILGMIFNNRIHCLYVPALNGQRGNAGSLIVDLLKPLADKYGTELVEYGAEVNTEEKIAAIAADELFMDALRTCWENPYRNYNCGRCATCSRNEKAQKIVKRLGSDEYEKFASGIEYQSRLNGNLRN